MSEVSNEGRIVKHEIEAEILFMFSEGVTKTFEELTEEERQAIFPFRDDLENMGDLTQDTVQ